MDSDKANAPQGEGGGAPGKKPGKGMSGDGLNVVHDSLWQRFGIALALIIIFGLTLGMSFNPSFATQPSVIIAAFSGWIATVITFFYTGQSMDAAIKQISAAKTEAADAKAEAKVTKDNAKDVLRTLGDKQGEVNKVAGIPDELSFQEFTNKRTKNEPSEVSSKQVALMKSLNDWDEAYKEALLKMI